MLEQREPLTKIQAAQLNPVALAFVGDTVYSLYVRERLALSGCGKVSQLQKVAAQVVSAKGQSEFLDKLLPNFTEEEAEIFRRGKNSSHLNAPKSASLLEYKIATGFEAVFGYLKLAKNEDRLLSLFSLAYPEI